MSDTELGCEECNKGWDHFHEPFEIQRCGTCESLKTDAEAVQHHRVDCGCDWPEVDHQNFFRRHVWYLYGNGEAIPELRTALERLHAVASNRDLFAANMPLLISLTGEIVSLYHQHWKRQEAHHSFYEALTRLASDLVEMASLVLRGLWKPHWTWEFEDGEVVGNKWFARRSRPSDVQEWDKHGFDAIFLGILSKHTPRLEAALREAKTRRPKPELSYKKVYAALKEALGDMKHSGMLYNTSLVEEAMRHLLEVHPDADIPEG